MKKRKNKKIKFNNENHVFHIPQIVKISGLRQQDTFKSEHAISPFSGYKVKDSLVPDSMLNETNDVEQRYDAYRRQQKISKEELIAKYGTKYTEFIDIHTNKAREEFLGHKVYGEEDNEVSNQTSIKPITNSLLNDKADDDLSFTSDSSLNFDNINKTITEMENANYEQYSFEDLPDFLKENAISDDQDFSQYTSSVTSSRNLEVDNFNFEDDTNFNESILNDKYEFATRPELLRREPIYDIFTCSQLNLREKPQWISENIKIINDTLDQFNIGGHVKETIKGPTITRYEVQLDPGINVNKITQIKDNLKMRLKAEEIRVLAPVPGKEYVGIEISNEEKDTVYFGNCINNNEFINSDVNGEKLRIVLGMDVDGNYIFPDLESMPHCLIGGATNSGKSVCVNSILVSLLIKNTPEDLRLILIDPKVVEFNVYNDIPHLLTPVINKPETAIAALSWAVDEMERRYTTISKARVKNIKAYNDGIATGEFPGEKLPYIVIVIDELADLMVTTTNEAETAIQRLTAKARAAGIHLIVATQRPTTDIVKGSIKANFTTRIAFKVATYHDSTVIIDEAGAEDLMGKGDMLYKSNQRIIRLQGAYLEDHQIRKAVMAISQNQPPNYVFDAADLARDSQLEEDDFWKAANYVVTTGVTSINALQDELKLGFKKAKKLMEELERHEIVSKLKDNRSRDVLMSIEQLKQLINDNDY